MTNSNKKKAEFLGMPYGTACGRLRKQIMFMLIQDSKNDTCFRCGEKIETVEELSVEHKKSWLNVSTKLFWDLNNIAFSHLSCNCKHGEKVNKVIAPNGFGWCKSCKRFLLMNKFPKNSDRFKDETRKLCSLCESKKNKGESPYI